jgi:type IV pilus assembly protein PilE
VKRGFTLVELLIVIIIVGILATVGFTQYTDVVERSRGAEAKKILGQLRTMCAARYMGSSVAECTRANLGIGSGTDLIPRYCRPSHYFSYAVATSGSSASFTATRCTASGKAPNHDTAHTVRLAVNYATGAHTYTSGAGY